MRGLNACLLLLAVAFPVVASSDLNDVAAQQNPSRNLRVNLFHLWGGKEVDSRQADLPEERPSDDGAGIPIQEGSEDEMPPAIPVQEGSEDEMPPNTPVQEESEDEMAPSIPVQEESEDEMLPPSFPIDKPSEDEIVSPSFAPDSPTGGSTVPGAPISGPTSGTDAPQQPSLPSAPSTPTEPGTTPAPSEFTKTLFPTFGSPRSCSRSTDCKGVTGYDGSEICVDLKSGRSIDICCPLRFVDVVLSNVTSVCGGCSARIGPTAAPTTFGSICDPVEECEEGRIVFCFSILGLTSSGCVARDSVPSLIANEAGFCGSCPEAVPTIAPTPVLADGPTSMPTIDDGLLPPSSPVAIGDPTLMPSEEDGPATSPVAAGAPTSMPTDEDEAGTSSPVAAGAPTSMPTSDEPVVMGPTMAPTGIPTTDLLEGCSPVVTCSLPFTGNEGVLVCLEISSNQFEACIPRSWVQGALDYGFCGECPSDAPSSTPTEFPTNEIPSGAPSAAPSGVVDLCEDEEVIPCGNDRINFCLTDVDYGGIVDEITICLPLSLLPQALPYGYCGECPALPRPTLGPTIDPLTGCDPAIPCEGLDGFYTGVDFCLQSDDGTRQASVCVPLRLVQASLDHGTLFSYNCTFGFISNLNRIS